MKEFCKSLKHMLWLWRQMIVLWYTGDFDGSYEAWLLIKIHWNYDGRKFNKGEFTWNK